MGTWVYFIALNLTILELTSSALAIGALFIMRPLALLITNTWSGSIIDRVNKRHLMIWTDLIRGGLVFLLLITENLWLIYPILLLISMSGSFFGPSSSVYITKSIPEEERQRFNSIMSTTNSGAFILGPALAGIIIYSLGTEWCFIFNALSFLVCAFFLYLLPNVDTTSLSKKNTISKSILKEDWKTVLTFVKVSKYFMIVYLFFQTAMLIGFALDSQEITFIKNVLSLSNQEYGLIMAIAGVGSIIGGLAASTLAKKISVKVYLSTGLLLSSICYLAFYSSFNFLSAVIAIVFLGFFLTFAYSGYTTFYQKQVPVEMMGRFGSLADMMQGVIQIAFTLLLGFLADWISLSIVAVSFSLLAVFLSVGLLFFTFKKKNEVIFADSTNSIKQ